MKSIEKEFKDIMLGLYQLFPNSRFDESYFKNKISITDTEMKQLIEKGYLCREKVGNKYTYSLGVNGLNLISAWKVEEMTKSIKRLTWAIVLLTLVLILSNFLFIS